MTHPPRLLYFSELSQFVWRKKNRFFQGGLCGFFLIFFGILFFKEPYFLAQANFHESKSYASGTSSSLNTILKGMQISYDQVEAISIMQSRQLLGQVVEKVGLQVRPKINVVTRFFARIINHLRRECRLESFTLEEGRFQNVQYSLEKPTVFYVQMVSDAEFEILDHEKLLVQKGILGIPISANECSFTLTKRPGKDLSCYWLVPKRNAIGELKKHLKVKSNRLDSKMLQLSCFHSNRSTAIDILDTLMDSFQLFMKKNHEQVAQVQTQYLQKRQEDLHKAYSRDLSEHKAFLEEILKEKGSVGLAREIEMLEKPKNEYKARIAELELASGRWKEIAAEHRFSCQKKHGNFEAKENFPWGNSSSSIQQNLSNKEDFSGMDLNTAQKFYVDYTIEKNQLMRKLDQIVVLQEELKKPEIEFSSLASLLEDPIFFEGIQACEKLALQLSDEGNHTLREQERFKESLHIQKQHLCEQVEKSKDLFQLKLDLVEQKMLGLQKKALELIDKEKHLLEEKLQEIAQKMENFPEKWLREQQLTLKKELSMQIIGGLAELSESKIVDHNLFHIESKPIDIGDAPPELVPPHLLVFSLMGGIFGGFGCLSASFIRTVSLGFPLSSLFLRERGYRFMGEIDKKQFEKWGPIDEKTEKILLRIAHTIQKERRVGLFGFPPFLSHHLAELLNKSKKRVLCLQWGESAEMSPFENHFIMIFEENGFNLLQDENFSSKILDQKKEIDCIFLDCRCSFSDPEALGLLSQCDLFILGINQESEHDLTSFSIDRTLCVLQK